MPRRGPVVAPEGDLRGATNVPRELSDQPRFDSAYARILRIMRCRTPPSLSGARVTPRSPLLQQGALQLTTIPNLECRIEEKAHHRHFSGPYASSAIPAERLGIA